MKYILFDSNDCLVTRYLSSAHRDIPSDAIEVSDEIFWKTIDETDGIWKINRDTGEIYKAPLPDPEPYVPQQITRAQGKAGLIKGNLMQSVDDYIESIEDATEKALALVALNDTTHWSRTSPFLNKAAKAIGLTDNDLDNLFIESAKIEL